MGDANEAATAVSPEPSEKVKQILDLVAYIKHLRVILIRSVVI